MNLDTYQPRVSAQLVTDYYPNGKRAGESRTITCPYCRTQHSHGAMLGHRSAHCTDYVAKRHQVVDPRDTRHTPGYVLCDPAEPVNWQLEYVYGQLFVLRSKYRRLRAEHQRMQPLGAREKRVKENLGNEIACIATVLRKAGVVL
ncbi:hypothetical protein HTV45_19710 [Streptomyces sp. CHD11]|uniref:hypothetical protein n=1 Tax=Streptomyces sp. CHD11 TaxID=2741325 RepID=UPI001BFC7488|nr:hypothetical protein [Streptomyces sp. CHD11]MBT3153066.1 hypothetical protein [Streptomyces sp. CHD11]